MSANNGKLVKIASVAEALNGSGRRYAVTLTGEAMFPRVSDMEFKAGQYAYVIQRKQTQSYLIDETTGERVKGEDGRDKLVAIAPDQQLTQLIMTSVFDSKADAVEAVAESGLLGAEVAAAVAQGARELKLDDAAVAKLSAAW